MQVYKHKQVDISNQRGLYTIYSKGIHHSGAYTLHNVVPDSTYKVTIDYGDFKGKVKLWIVTEGDKVTDYGPHNILTDKQRRSLKYCFHSGRSKKAKIGFIFTDKKRDNYFQIRSINIEMINKPEKSIPEKKLAIIVPYRDRESHLKQFIPHMKKYLKNFNCQIFVIHQKNDKLFNRAALFNIGFHILKDKFDYFSFHDVDFLPEAADYSYPKMPAHLPMYYSKNDYKMHKFFGGVVLITKEQFIKMNGFSNKYAGWGAEDDDLYLRAMRHCGAIHRPGKYLSLDHKHVGRAGNPNYTNNVGLYRKMKKHPELLDKEGLRDVGKKFKYKILGYHRIRSNGDLQDANNMKYQNRRYFMIDVDF